MGSRYGLLTLQPRVRELGSIVEEKLKAKGGRDPRRTLQTNSSAWRALRARILAEEPLCRMCGQPATDIDHANGNPADNRRVNLAPLCHACHSHKTTRERAGLKVNHGCDANGMPRDPDHPWNQSKNR